MYFDWDDSDEEDSTKILSPIDFSNSVSSHVKVTDSCKLDDGTRDDTQEDVKYQEKTERAIQQLMKQISDVSPNESVNKVSIIGLGVVGMATAFAILIKEVSNEIVLISRNPKKVKGEMMDLQHGLSFLNSATVTASTDYKCTENSKIIIITVGARQVGKQTRMDVLEKNIEMYKEIIPQVAKYSPECIFVIASNPVDVMAYATWKLSGFPTHRVIGSGTALDTSRFKFLISQRLRMSTQNCHGWIIGEHGPLCVPVWSSVNIAGIYLQDIYPEVDTEWTDITQKVIASGPTVRMSKGNTSWAIGLSICSIVNSILTNSNDIQAVSTLVQGIHGIERSIYLSLPCVLGRNGVTNVIQLKLSQAECEQLNESVEKLIGAFEVLNL